MKRLFGMLILIMVAGCDGISSPDAEINSTVVLENAKSEMLEAGIDPGFVGPIIARLSELSGIRSVTISYLRRSPKSEAAAASMTSGNYDTGILNPPNCCGSYRFQSSESSTGVSVSAYTESSPAATGQTYGLYKYVRSAIYRGSPGSVVLLWEGAEEHWRNAQVSGFAAKGSYTSFCTVSDHWFPPKEGTQDFSDAFVHCWDD